MNLASHREMIDDDAATLGRRLRRNVSLRVIGSSLSVEIKLAQAVLLTRFLPIDDYGRVLIALNFFIFLE